MELYGANVLWYEQGLAFDDTSWAHVTGEIGVHDAALGEEATALSFFDRLPWLVDRDLVGFAYQALEDEVARRAEGLRQEARAIAPDLELALYMPVAVNHWFYRGLLRGFGTPERPALWLTYDLATEPLRVSLEAEGIYVRILAGVFGVRFTPEDLGAAVYEAASRSDGHWLFQLGDFPADDAGPMPAHAPPSAYWSAIEAAHEALSGL
jgi:hypothetical protein